MKVIFDVLNRAPGIKLEQAEVCEPFKLTKAEAPELATWQGLYQNAEAFARGVLETGEIPRQLPKIAQSKYSQSRWF